jgi:exopolyphosphatase/guanosine-5'-triphosphate,3'-diphosphate pyrophosphatase
VIRIVATAAVRDAPNRDELGERVHAATGREIEIISGDEEARLAHESVAHAFDLAAVRAGVADIGGGSTEVVLSAGGLIQLVASAPLGAVRLADRFGPVDAAHEASYRRMYRFIRSTLRDALEKPEVPPQVVFGTGGTFTSLANISLNRALAGRGSGGAAGGGSRGGSDGKALPYSVRGYEVPRSELRHTIEWLRGMTPEERRAVPGLSTDRAEIIIPGLAIAEAVLRRLGVNLLRVHDRGVRDGILLSTLRGVFFDAEPGADTRLGGVIAFGRRCNFEERHSRHVAELALSLFDQAAAQCRALEGKEPMWAAAPARDVLQAAALLRDVGYFVNYKGHHKHSYTLIVNAELPGYSPREIELIASIARYHRKAKPKKKHEHFRKLSESDREIVRRLSALLRVADGLDRTQAQAVSGVELTLTLSEAALRVHASEDPAADVCGAERKADVFESAFGVPMRVEWAGEVGDHGGSGGAAAGAGA